MKRDSFVIYRSYYEAFANLAFKDKAKMLDAIMDYGLNGNEPQLTGALKAIWMIIKPLMDVNNQRYINGTKGGRPPKSKPSNNQSKTKSKPSNNQSKTLMNNELCIMNNELCVMGKEQHTQAEDIIAEYQSEQHKAWHESLAMTYRLERADVLQCIEDGVHYCVNMGIDLTRSNVMRYTKTACERYKPALKPLQDRKTAFASECKQLKADANLVGEFYEYYTQPMRDNDDCMLFESFRSWNTATRFKQFLNRKQHGN